MGKMEGGNSSGVINAVRNTVFKSFNILSISAFEPVLTFDSLQEDGKEVAIIKMEARIGWKARTTRRGSV
jgi:hypothetical protein